MSEKLKKPIRKTKSKAVRKRWWRKAHRLIGISSVAFLLLLSATGLMLNHIDDWFDGDQYVSSPILLDWYGIQAPQDILQLNLREAMIVHPYWADDQLFIDNKLVPTPIGKPMGTFIYDSLLFILTDTSVELLTVSGEHVEKVRTPERVQSGELFKHRLILKGKQSHSLDLNKLTFSQPTKSFEQLTSSRLSGTISRIDFTSPQAKIIRQHRLLQSKVLQDLHSGRILGRYGVLLFNIFALLFVILAISGIFLWSRGISKA